MNPPPASKLIPPSANTLLKTSRGGVACTNWIEHVPVELVVSYTNMQLVASVVFLIRKVCLYCGMYCVSAIYMYGYNGSSSRHSEAAAKDLCICSNEHIRVGLLIRTNPNWARAVFTGVQRWDLILRYHEQGKNKTKNTQDLFESDSFHRQGISQY